MGLATEKLRGSGVALSCNVREKEEVAALYETALAAGARGTREPHDIFWGRHVAYAADPEGHVWEFAWKPFSALGAGGISVGGGGVTLAKGADWGRRLVLVETTRARGVAPPPSAAPTGTGLRSSSAPSRTPVAISRRCLSSISPIRGPLTCVWSAVRIQFSPQIDHCLPWARWRAIDLWNSLLARDNINLNKTDQRLDACCVPSARNTATLARWRMSR